MTEENEARQVLRAFLNFRQILDGAIKLEDKLAISLEISKIEVLINHLIKDKFVSEEAKKLKELLAEFISLLPDYNNKDFKTRRKTITKLKEMITLTARIIATKNKEEFK